MIRFTGADTLKTVSNAVNKTAEFGRKLYGFLPFVFFEATILYASSLVQPANAGREVLSDLDCVVEPSAVVLLGAAVPGQLSTTRFDRSDFVSAGVVMATLESRVEKATLAISEEVATNATALELRRTSASFGLRTKERNETLLQTSSISTQTMDQFDTESRIAALQVQQEQENLRLAQLRVERDRAAVERRMIVSPIDGTVVKRFKSTGEYVDNDPVFEIAQLNPLHIEVIVPLEHLGKIESGMRGGITILAPEFDDQVLDAQVRRIDAVSDAASATYGVRLVLDNPELSIPSGVRCQVDFFSS